MGHFFISYAREDGDFVRRLHDALTGEGRETWVDWEGIPPSDKWMARIEGAIDEADAVLFVLTPDSAASQVCQQELDCAVDHNKRLIPILRREVDEPVRKELAELNWIFMRDSDPFEVGLSTLIEAADTDLEWVRTHTRLLVRAVEWDRMGREPSLTLRGKDLGAFEDWAAAGQSKEPRPTALQSEYLLASRRAVTRRQRMLFAAGTVALTVAAVLGTVAWFQNAERARQAEIVAARALLSRSEAARDMPGDEGSARASHADALRFAAQALGRLARVEAPIADADLALRKSYATLEKWREDELPNARIEALALDPSGRFLLRYHEDGEIVRREIGTAEDGTTCRRRPNASETDVTVATSAGGGFVALAFGTRGDDEALNALEVWDIEACDRLTRAPLAMFSGIGLSRDGRRLVTVSRGEARIVELETGEARALAPTLGAVRDAAFSPDATALVLYTRNRGESETFVRVVDAGSGAERDSWQYDGRIRRVAWVAAGIFVHGDRAHLYTPEGRAISDAPVSGDLAVVSEDGQLLAEATRKGAVGLISMVSGRPIASDWWSEGIERIGFGLQGRSIVVAGTYHRFLASWHALDRGAYALLEMDGQAEGLEFADDGRLEAWAGDRAAVWDLAVDPEAAKVADTLADVRLPEGPASALRDPGRASVDGGYDMAVARARSGLEAVIVAGEITRAGPERRLVLRRQGVEITGKGYEPVFDSNLDSFLAFAGDDRYLVIGTREGLEVISAETLDPVTVLYHANATAVGLSADGRRAATGDRRGRIKIWNVAEGTQQREIETVAEITALALSDDGDWVAGLGRDRRVRLWTLSPDTLIAQACRWLEAPCP